jgi:hypothetical protein
MRAVPVDDGLPGAGSAPMGRRMPKTENRRLSDSLSTRPAGTFAIGKVALVKRGGMGTEGSALAEAAIRAGRAHMGVGAWGSALLEFGRAHSLAPNLIGARLYQLWAQWKTCPDPAERRASRPQLVREIADTLVRDPGFGFCHYVVGVLRMEDDELEKAERSLTRSLRLDPSNRDAERHLRIVRMRLGLST